MSVKHVNAYLLLQYKPAFHTQQIWKYVTSALFVKFLAYNYWKSCTLLKKNKCVTELVSQLMGTWNTNELFPVSHNPRCARVHKDMCHMSHILLSLPHHPPPTTSFSSNIQQLLWEIGRAINWRKHSHSKTPNLRVSWINNVTSSRFPLAPLGYFPMNCKAFSPHLCQTSRHLILSKWAVLLMLPEQYTCVPSAVNV